MIQDIALKLFKRVPQIARKSVATTLPSVEAGLKSTKLNGDVLNLTQESKLISLAENVLGRKLELKSLTSMLDKEHVLGEGWHGTINCLNDKIRMGYPLDIIGDLVTKVDDVILSGKKTIADSIAYRGESYSIKNKHLQIF